MRYLRFILLPFTLIYGLIVVIRNLFYNAGIFKSSRFSIPVICVGNLSMGGTGKTPHTEYLIRLLKDQYKVATLSRGFGRKEHGFRIADAGSTARTVGDEPLQYYAKFGHEVTVAVEANRVHGVLDICRERPETNLILLDDAFQHRRIHAGLSVLLTNYYDPFYRDFLLPVGTLREPRWGKKRADIMVVTKCPVLNEKDKKKILFKLRPKPGCEVFFSSLRYGNIISLSDGKVLENNGYQIILVTGIAETESLVAHLSQNHEIIHHFKYRDHYLFSSDDLREIHGIFDKFAGPQTIVVTTEKDAMRLLDPAFETELKNCPWYYQPIEVELDRPEEFNKLILNYVEKNS